MTQVRTGGCQCGRIRFRAASLRDNSHVCHCRMCQKATGNFFAALVGVPLTDFVWTRGTPAVFRSSAKVQRGFCRDCGTSLFFRHDDNHHVSMSIGAFDEPASIPLDFQLGMEGRLPQIDQLPGLKHYGTTEQTMPEAAPRIRASNNQHPDHDTADWTPKA
ncbi:MAG: GFA family protein [Hyphomonas sp.]|uniref:GFA family protein n=1 Tax=Hyphomonas sp. TaxID=87 RepID=UPI0017EAEFA3|nr:GFA family protein [Hyphomonas sp.]MBA3069738.1 GFA family protein [Hyphomonas sp.]MBU3920606.1 GFA family protein [Alphaproteobacteria bacterium]MBU4062579.1 GFA family protein [Alphaproteobacteria bacterium]MBU4163930.1 GFA family protein [Alphaproteobacteria bacterium]